MKLKKLSLLAGAIAVAFSITPLAANAQVNSNAAQRVAQANRQGPELNLSVEQQEKLSQIQQNIGNQIQAVLTPEQRKEVQTGLQAGKPARQIFASLNFSEPQKTQLQNIWATSQKQMVDVLNAKQKEELKKWQASQRSQRQRK